MATGKDAWEYMTQEEQGQMLALYRKAWERMVDSGGAARCVVCGQAWPVRETLDDVPPDVGIVLDAVQVDTEGRLAQGERVCGYCLAAEEEGLMTTWKRAQAEA
jgi:hypothetical protein